MFDVIVTSLAEVIVTAVRFGTEAGVRFGGTPAGDVIRWVRF